MMHRGHVEISGSRSTALFMIVHTVWYIPISLAFFS